VVWHTIYGSNRYDGYTFKVFKHEPGQINSLSGVLIYSLFKDRSGVLWVGCDESLDRFDPATETFTHYRIDSPDAAVETAHINQISQDPAGNLWLATRKGLYRFDPSTGTVIRYQHDANNPFSLSSSNIKSTGEERQGTFWVANSKGLDAFDREKGKVTLHIPLHERGEMSFYEDSSGLLWIVHVTGNGLAVFDRKTNTLTSYSFHKGHVSNTLPTGAMAILEDRDGNLWIETMGDGLLKFDRQSRTFIRYQNDPMNPQSLAENAVHTLFQDREGNIWAGLHMMAPNRFSTRPPPFEVFKHEPGKPNSLSGTMVNDIYEDRQRALWISAMNGLNRIDRKTGKYTFYLPARPGLYSEPLALVKDRFGLLWVGSDGDGLIRLDPNTGRLKAFQHNPLDRSTVSSDIVTQLFIDHTGTLWATTFNGLDHFDEETSSFTKYEFEEQSAAPEEFVISEDSSGSLWIGTPSGLESFDPATQQFTHIYKHDANDSTSMNNNRVNAVYFDQSGTMWVGTQEGLDRFDAKTGRFTTYYEQDGLAGNAVSCILEDKRGSLWMGTNNGLSVFDPMQETFKNYSSADGLPGADLTGWGACFKSPSGEMFFGDSVEPLPFVPTRS
jgi:ligand-binding sensor domain-containing protein